MFNLCAMDERKQEVAGAPMENRTPVLALKGPRPGPLDDGGHRRRILSHEATKRKGFAHRFSCVRGDGHPLSNSLRLCYYSHMPLRIIVVTGLAIAGLSGFLLAAPGHFAVTLPVAGSVTLAYQTALQVGTYGVLIIGVLDAQPVPQRRRLITAVLALCLAVGFFISGPLLLPTLPVALLLAGFAMLLMLLLITYLIKADDGQADDICVLVRHIVVYTTALLTFAGIYQMHLRAMGTVAIVGLAAAVLAVILQPEHAWLPWRTSTIVTGIVLATAAWALLFWPVTPLVAGATCLAIFYTTTGVLSARDTESGRKMAEFALVGLIALAMIVVAALRSR